jgi:cellulose synthase/poly-beta-1,6-N-acetylglucosamine synthase-like glycosyltransferase
MLIYGGYYFVTSVFGFIKVKQYPDTPETTKFAVIIAARNESSIIENLIVSLKKQNYPDELYDIFVVPNNCTDNTAEIAASLGAMVVECTDEVRNKGEVLSFIFRYIIKNKDIYDAYCVFDADNLAHPGFLKSMNNAANNGAKIAQGYRDSKNPSDSFFAGYTSIYYWVINGFFNQSRMILGSSGLLNGTGFMVAAEVIRDHGFETSTLTEDLEFSGQCALNGYSIKWIPDAITYDEQPLTFGDSWKQRRRWSTGAIQCMQKYGKPLLRKAIKDKNMLCWDLVMLYICPIMQVFGIIPIGIYILLNLFNISVTGSMASLQACVISIVLAFGSAFVMSIVSAFAVVLKEKKNVLSVLGSVITFAFFILTWIPINVICVFTKDCVWHPIMHTRTLKLSDIEESVIENE